MVLSELMLWRQFKNSFISLSLGYLIEYRMTSFNLWKQSISLCLSIFQMPSMLSFLLSWQIRSCSTLDTSWSSPFFISCSKSQLKFVCFSTVDWKATNSGALLITSCISSKLCIFRCLFFLVASSCNVFWIFVMTSAKIQQTFFRQNSSSISERTNSRASFSFIDSASRALFSSSDARKALCLFFISTLLSQIPQDSCNTASYVQGVIRGVTTSSLRQVMISIARQSLGQSLGFFMSSSSNFRDTCLAIQAQASESAIYLTWGSVLRDIATEMSPSEMRLTNPFQFSFQNSLFFMMAIVEGILREKIFLPTGQQSRQTSCRFLILSEESTSASSEMSLSSMELVKNR